MGHIIATKYRVRLESRMNYDRGGAIGRERDKLELVGIMRDGIVEMRSKRRVGSDTTC